MRRFITGVGLLCSGAITLALVALIAPLAWALRRDREERNRVDALNSAGEVYPYNDDDPGDDVDDDIECNRCGGCLIERDHAMSNCPGPVQPGESGL